MCRLLFIICFVALLLYARCADNRYVRGRTKNRTVFVAVLVRNKAHTLPYFLTAIENLDYPKDRITLWIRSDHNVDDSDLILRAWTDSVGGKYHSVDLKIDDSEGYFADESGVAHWSARRFDHVIRMREEALETARRMWADYVLFVDADVFLIRPSTLTELMSRGHVVTSPMLKSDGLYSNFWCGMTQDYYYERTDDYKPILGRERTGCFAVPMVHSAVLIDLRAAVSDKLTFFARNVADYDGPNDDIISFAISANRSGIPLHVCNDEIYGFVMVPLEQTDTFEHDLFQLTNLKLEVLTENEPLAASPLFDRYVKPPEKDTLGFDEIYMINLVRRPERRLRMHRCFDVLGIKATTIDAVDGRALNETTIKQWDINLMPDYSDPYHKRPMTLGEIGCFLSHYVIWQQVVEKNHSVVLVLEDDIHFEPFFKLKLELLMAEIDRLPAWDLVYLGRKRLQEEEEQHISRLLVKAGYSYWTLGYILSASGARKLLAAEPLQNLLPVDEYLPILFDQHPKDSWKKHFPNRNLIGLSASPLLVYPTHYTGENGYVSDTEDSTIVDADESDEPVFDAVAPASTGPSAQSRDDL